MILMVVFTGRTFSTILIILYMLYFSCCGTSAGLEVMSMCEIITAFIISVAAGITSYYICKWLDGDD